jgi:hypothetical protein
MSRCPLDEQHDGLFGSHFEGCLRCSLSCRFFLYVSIILKILQINSFVISDYRFSQIFINSCFKILAEFLNVEIWLMIHLSKYLLLDKKN